MPRNSMDRAIKITKEQKAIKIAIAIWKLPSASRGI